MRKQRILILALFTPIFLLFVIARVDRKPSTDPTFEPTRWRDRNSRRFMWRDLQWQLRSTRPNSQELYHMLGTPVGFDGKNAEQFAAWVAQMQGSRLMYEVPTGRSDWLRGESIDYVVVFLDPERRATDCDMVQGD